MDTLFLITLQYIKPQYAIDAYYSKHTAYLEELSQKGIFICCGRKKLKNGEFILCKADDRRMVKELISQDPFDQFQLAIYQTVEYNLICADEAFSRRS